MPRSRSPRRDPRAIELLKPEVAKHVRHGHPFVWRAALRLPADLQVGEVVELRERGGRFVARGTVDPSSPVAFRAWTLDPNEALDEALLVRRLEQAAALRREVIAPDVTAYRLCHGENDRVPGLQCDLYIGEGSGTVAALRTDGALGIAWEERFVAAVRRVTCCDAVVVRNPERDRGAARLVFGALPDELIVRERTRRFHVDVLRGQKTGLFLDQRDNRDRVGALAAGRRVLNLFCYTGGFSLAAAQGGATIVRSVDIAAPAVDEARRNFELNGIDPKPHVFEAADAFVLLGELARRPPAYDLCVLDPPAFAPNESSLPDARRAYLRLNELALRALPAGGWLATASCSSHLREAEFLAILGEAAQRARRAVTVAGVHGAAPDHPVRPGFPEGHYLKFVLLRIAEARSSRA